MPFMIQKRSCTLNAEFNWHFYDIIKICLIVVNNVNLFTMYESLLENFMKMLPTICQSNLDFCEKWAKFEL